jgi:hypothetical protein
MMRESQPQHSAIAVLGNRETEATHRTSTELASSGGAARQTRRRRAVTQGAHRNTSDLGCRSSILLGSPTDFRGSIAITGSPPPHAGCRRRGSSRLVPTSWIETLLPDALAPQSRRARSQSLGRQRGPTSSHRRTPLQTSPRQNLVSEGSGGGRRSRLINRQLHKCCVHSGTPFRAPLRTKRLHRL